MNFRTNITEQLTTFVNYYCGDVLASLIAIKGKPGVAESAGAAPFAGADGLALDKAFGRLGWGYGSQDTRIWLGILLAPLGSPPLKAEQIRLICEIIDPLAIVALDESAHATLAEAYNSVKADIHNDFPLSSQTNILGRRFISVSGFEDSLADENAKQRVWAELKRCGFPG